MAGQEQWFVVAQGVDGTSLLGAQKFQVFADQKTSCGRKFAPAITAQHCSRRVDPRRTRSRRCTSNKSLVKK